MKKLLNYVLIVGVLVVVLFSLAGCGSENVEEIVVEEVNNENNVETEDVEDENINLEDDSFDGVYVGKKEDNMEGLAIIADGPDKLVLIKDVNGTGSIRVGGEEISGNYMEKEFLNENLKITDAGENIKFNHPRFTYGEEVEMIPATGEFCGIYQNDYNYLVIFKNFNDEMTVAYMETKFDNALSATMSDFAITESTLEGKDDSYKEPIKITLDGDKLTFNIDSEDSRWNNANIEYTKMK